MCACVSRKQHLLMGLEVRKGCLKQNRGTLGQKEMLSSGKRMHPSVKDEYYASWLIYIYLLKGES